MHACVYACMLSCILSLALSSLTWLACVHAPISRACSLTCRSLDYKHLETKCDGMGPNAVVKFDEGGQRLRRRRRTGSNREKSSTTILHTDKEQSQPIEIVRQDGSSVEFKVLATTNSSTFYPAGASSSAALVEIDALFLSLSLSLP